MNEFFRRLHYLLNRKRFDRELANDMDFHREMANLHGARNFGSTLRLRDESRDAWGWTWIDRLGQDLRYAIRLMQRSPGFAFAAVLMLAVGIGINVAAFGFFNLVLFRPLPVTDPDTLLRFHRLAPNQYSSDLPYRAMEFYRDHTRTLSEVLALRHGNLFIEDSQNTIRGFFVTPNFHNELGAQIELGRLLDPTIDGKSDSEPVAVLGYNFWQQQFGSDQTVVGRMIRLNGKEARIVGVISTSFSGLTFSAPDVWLPIQLQPYFVEGSDLLSSLSPEDHGIDMWGRLRPGISPQAAETELRLLAEQLRKVHREMTWEGESVMAVPGGYAQNAGGRVRSNSPSPSLQRKMFPIFALAGAFSLLLLAVACANLGSLLLARGVARQREIMIRKSLGAGSRRLLRQLLTESLVLAALGSAAGLYLGTILLETILLWSGGPQWVELTPDWRIVGYTIAIGCVAVIVFGFSPALHAIRQRHRSTLTRKLLVSVQVSASCVLLIVAALFVRALGNALHDSPGFEYKQAISIDPRLQMHGYSPGAASAYMDTLQQRLLALPGVDSVSVALNPPFGGRTTTVSGGSGENTFPVYANRTTPEFFRTMNIPIVLGRNLRPDENSAVLVSESVARRLWPGGDPLSQHFEVNGEKLDVVGVVGDARMVDLSNAQSSEMLYQAIGVADLVAATVLIRTTGSVEDLAREAIAIARSIDPRLMPSMKTLKEAYARRLDSTERIAIAITILGFVALFLACFGILGVVSFEVSQRTRELGIRMALGAKPGQILNAVLRQFTVPVLLGVGLGIAGAAGISQFLVGQLHGISHLDPPAYVAAAILLAVASLLAALPAASRALRLDPVKALRAE